MANDKDKGIYVRITPEEWRRLRVVAARRDSTAAKVATEATRKELARMEAEDKAEALA